MIDSDNLMMTQEPLLQTMIAVKSVQHNPLIIHWITFDCCTMVYYEITNTGRLDCQ